MTTGTEWWFPIIQKITSARFWMVLLVIGTLCIAVLKCFNLVIQVLQVQDEKVLTFVKEIIMFILGAFVSVVSSISVLYFGRNDRKDSVPNSGGNNNGDNGNNGTEITKK